MRRCRAVAPAIGGLVRALLGVLHARFTVISTLPSLLVLVVGFGLGLGACAGELENPERFADCQPGGVEAMFEKKCAGDCHAGDRPEAGLDLTGVDVAARLIGKASSTQSCDGRMVV